MDRSYIIAALVITCGFHAQAARPEIAPHENLIRPYRGLAYTAKDVPSVRELAVSGKNAALVERIFEVTEEWMKRSNEEIVSLMPKPGSLFAYGSAGDPRTGQEWPRFGASGICSLDRPGEVRSPHTGDVYGIQKPGEPYYDKGDGWTRPEDGQRFYFRGIWNSFVVDSLHHAVDHMALAYLLTGNAEIAEKALFILDQLATLRVQMPIAGYSVADWPHPTDRHLKKGFFRYMGNLANQRVINTFLALDLLGNAPYASAPSSHSEKGGRRKTVLENIATNYFDIYEEWYLKEGSLTNHATILIGNILAHGVFFGDAGQLKQGIDGTYAFLENTLNRDGDYIEVSGSYGRLGRDYGGRMIALLANYNPENYPNAKELPSAADYPYSLRFGNDPRWYRTAVEMLYRLPIMGRFPQHGDMTPDRNVLLNRDNQWLAKSRSQYLRMLYQQTSRAEWKQEIEALYAKAVRQPQSPLQIEDLLLYGVSQWAEPPSPQEQTEVADKSELIGGKRIAILRDGEGRNKRALFMRGGANSYHGHDDQMAVVPYGHGMMLQGEYGYRWAGTPDHLGWGSRSVGHLTAVVDEDLPAPYLFKGYNLSTPAPAADVTGFLSRLPAQFVEMSNPRLWARSGLKDYRRTSWLIGVDQKRYYFVDFFQIVGGKTHDYVWMAPFASASDDEAFELEGVQPASENGVWTLASLSGAHRRKPWNQPGQSWGERLDGGGGKVLPLPREKELPTTKWNPEPGNGYGMIWDVRSQKTDEDWQATWKLVDNRHFLKAQYLNFDGMVAVAAKAPTLSRGSHFNMTVGRRTGEPPSLRSRFANVIQVGQREDWPLVKAERVTPSASLDAKDAAAVRVELPNGERDLLLASRQIQEVRTEEARMVGRNAFVRLDDGGGLVHLALQESTLLEAGNWRIEAASPGFYANVVAVETGEDSSGLTVEGELPAGKALSGAMVLISGAEGAAVPTSANEYYSVETVERHEGGRTTFVFKKQSLVGGYFHVKEVIPGTSKVNLAWRNEVAGLPGSFAFQGQGVVPAGETAGAPMALVKKIAYREVELTSVSGVSAGQKLKVLTAKPGDRVALLLTVTMQRQAGGEEYHLYTTGKITITHFGAAGARLLASAPGSEPQEVARADAQGELVATLSPETVGSSEIHLRIERF